MFFPLFLPVQMAEMREQVEILQSGWRSHEKKLLDVTEEVTQSNSRTAETLKGIEMRSAAPSGSSNIQATKRFAQWQLCYVVVPRSVSFRAPSADMAGLHQIS